MRCWPVVWHGAVRGGRGRAPSRRYCAPFAPLPTVTVAPHWSQPLSARVSVPACFHTNRCCVCCARALGLPPASPAPVLPPCAPRPLCIGCPAAVIMRAVGGEVGSAATLAPKVGPLGLVRSWC